MEKKRVRIVLFSAWGSDYKEAEFSISVFVMMIIGMICGIAFITGSALYGTKFTFQYFYKKHQTYKSEMLITEFHQLKNHTEELALNYEKARGLTGTFLWVENKTTTWNDSTASLTGRGGAYIDDEDNILPTFKNNFTNPDGNLYRNNSLGSDIQNYDGFSFPDLLAQLESRITNTNKTYNVITEKFDQRRKQLEHIPSVKPILNGRITDFFGKRVDPFARKVRHHRGLDIAAPRGTAVYAPAAGTIEVAKIRYRLNKGYGRVVIINHGFGMKTLYGHLNKVKVKIGQKVNRWDTLGTVGETGRATGPHLHYEVWIDEKARDPVEFIINE